MGKPKHRRVLPEAYVNVLYEYLEDHGHSPEQILEHSWPKLPSHDSGGIPVEKWQAMLEAAATRLNDPLVALHLARTVTTRHLGVLGALVVACESVGAALQRLDRYQRLIFDVIPMSVNVVSDGVELKWDTHEYLPGGLVEQLGFAVLAQMLRILVRGGASPQAIRFMHAGPSDTSAYEAYFGCPVCFGQAEASIHLSNEVLASPLRSPDPDLVATLDRHADEQLAKLPQEDELVEMVRRELVHLLPAGVPDIESVAAKLSCSSRTLQRKLSLADTSFRKELNFVRHGLARIYMQDSRLKVVHIALLLGYSEHSAFTRAYKAWTGVSPEQERAGFED